MEGLKEEEEEEEEEKVTSRSTEINSCLKIRAAASINENTVLFC